MFEIFVSILPFIIPTALIGDNLSYLITSLIGLIYILINIKTIKENKYFYTLILMWLLIFIGQLFISSYIESISGSFIYFNMPIYYLIYKDLFNKEDNNKILNNIIIAMMIVCIITLIYQGMYLNIRVFGNLGYANSYALLLLIGLYLNKIREEDKLSSLIDIIFLVGILYTGSRTTLLLLLIYFVYDVYKSIKINEKENIVNFIKILIISFILYILLEKLRLTAIFIIPILYILYKLIKDIKLSNKIYYFLGIIAILITTISNTNTVNRIKNISLNAGTFQERLVYYEDSIKTIIKNPLGNGINMFQYKQYEAASAFYDVKYIHNSFLQIFYDTGIINFIIFMIIIIIGFIAIIKSTAKFKDYLLLSYISILLHSILDFDLSFTIFLILLVFLKVLSEKNYKKEFNRNNLNLNKEKGKSNNKNEISKEKNNIDYVLNKKTTIKKASYIIILLLIIYLSTFEVTLQIGKEILDKNNNLASNLLNTANKISFNKDYRGYFYRADVLRNINKENQDAGNEINNIENNKYLNEAIESLEIAKNINPYDPRVSWNIAYLYEEIGDSEKALTYWEEVLEKEKFYTEAYIKKYDCLIKLATRNSGNDSEVDIKENKDEVNENIKYKKQLDELEKLYYENYRELNKRAKYMKNQLQENYEDIRNENVDYTILLNGEYEKELKYYDQEDERWANVPYKTEDNPLGKTGCGITSMAIIESTIKEKYITPIELADYSIENDYCNNNTEVEFFEEIVKEDKYKLNVEKFDGNEIAKVKNLISEGKHMAIALMRPGHFTKEGHYLVIYGIETISGVNYFKILDPNKNNKNYIDDGNIIYNNPKDGYVKVKTSLILEQAINYWVYK